MINHLLWDITGPAPKSFWGWLWATWRLPVAVAGAALLTWLEWKEHHPSDIAMALIQFVFVLVAIAFIVGIGRWFSRNNHYSK